MIDRPLGLHLIVMILLTGQGRGGASNCCIAPFQLDAAMHHFAQLLHCIIMLHCTIIGQVNPVENLYSGLTQNQRVVKNGVMNEIGAAAVSRHA
ncbi:hypothetical protein [uncultured Thiodictyon sp.]|uniref:hypothetical protein n=1 Tax=uncultured Thiodictyon sp. TaxID=1846217 RepID=UPI0025CE8E01|nr:hypothetical protein [uncultured Thiodictyon sp.]